MFFTDVMFDNQAYVDTASVLQMTYVISLNQQQIYEGIYSYDYLYSVQPKCRSSNKN